MTHPTLEEIHTYCEEKHPKVDPIAFFLHYETNGWMVGKVPMKNWRAGVANWDRMQQTRNGGNKYAKQLPQTFAERDQAGNLAAFARARDQREGTFALSGEDDTRTLPFREDKCRVQDMATDARPLLKP